MLVTPMTAVSAPLLRLQRGPFEYGILPAAATYI
jgi:hypothetical protein